MENKGFLTFSKRAKEIEQQARENGGDTASHGVPLAMTTHASPHKSGGEVSEISRMVTQIPGLTTKTLHQVMGNYPYHYNNGREALLSEAANSGICEERRFFGYPCRMGHVNKDKDKDKKDKIIQYSLPPTHRFPVLDLDTLATGDSEDIARSLAACYAFYTSSAVQNAMITYVEEKQRQFKFLKDAFRQPDITLSEGMRALIGRAMSRSIILYQQNQAQREQQARLEKDIEYAQQQYNTLKKEQYSLRLLAAMLSSHHEMVSETFYELYEWAQYVDTSSDHMSPQDISTVFSAWQRLTGERKLTSVRTGHRDGLMQRFYTMHPDALRRAYHRAMEEASTSQQQERVRKDARYVAEFFFSELANEAVVMMSPLMENREMAHDIISGVLAAVRRNVSAKTAEELRDAVKHISNLVDHERIRQRDLLATQITELDAITTIHEESSDIPRDVRAVAYEAALPITGDGLSETDEDTIMISVVPTLGTYADFLLKTDGVVVARYRDAMAFLPIDIKFLGYDNKQRSSWRSGDVQHIKHISEARGEDQDSASAHSTIICATTDGDDQVFDSLHNVNQFATEASSLLLKAIARLRRCPEDQRCYATSDTAGAVRVYAITIDELTKAR